MRGRVLPKTAPAEGARARRGVYDVTIASVLRLSARAAGQERVGGLGFDWAFTACTTWLMGGAFLDGWAHNRGLPDSFWTPWHGVLYSGFAVCALFLMAALLRNQAPGRAWWEALPAGYGISLVGAAVFALGGLADMTWHTIFGVEVNFDAVVSASHLMLVAGIALTVSGPAAAAWRRRASTSRAPGLTSVPMVLALLYAFTILTFITQYASPFALMLGRGAQAPSVQLTSGRLNLAELIQIRSLFAVVLYAALLVGTLLLAVRRRTLPAGSLTMLLGANAIATVVMRGPNLGADAGLALAAIALVAGAIGDALLWYLAPSPSRPWAARLLAFAVPACLYAVYAAVTVTLFGTWWTPAFWVGVVAMGGLTGLLLSYLAIPSGPPGEPAA